MADTLPRQEAEFEITTLEQGKITLKLLDRITVDDVFLHLVNQEVYRVVVGEDTGSTVSPLFIEFLIKEGFAAR